MKEKLLKALVVVVIPFGITAHAVATAEPKPIEYIAEPEEPVEVRIEVEIDWTQERLRQEVDTQAAKYKVSAERMWKTIKCEATDPDTRMVSTTIQSFHRTVSGEREPSFGVSQIHRPSHPSVTYEQAIDPQFAIEFMAKAFAAGEQRMWTCYRHLYM